MVNFLNVALQPGFVKKKMYWPFVSSRFAYGTKDRHNRALHLWQPCGNAQAQWFCIPWLLWILHLMRTAAGVLLAMRLQMFNVCAADYESEQEWLSTGKQNPVICCVWVIPLLPSRSLWRFMPRVEIVQKHNTAARRLYIRGHNGKIYPYLVMNDACLTESRREERVLQLLRLLNPCLEKRKETTKRHLFFTGRSCVRFFFIESFFFVCVCFLRKAVCFLSETSK